MSLIEIKKNIRMDNTTINTIEKTFKKRWKRVLSFGNLCITIGFSNENNALSLVAEILKKKGNLLYIDKYALQQIKRENKIRVAYHKQNKILEKLQDGQ